MNRGSLGVRELNVRLQIELNPARSDEPVVEKFGWQFRLRDKVIQTENDYDKDVFNGDIGRAPTRRRVRGGDRGARGGDRPRSADPHGRWWAQRRAALQPAQGAERDQGGARRFPRSTRSRARRNGSISSSKRPSEAGASRSCDGRARGLPLSVARRGDRYVDVARFGRALRGGRVVAEDASACRTRTASRSSPWSTRSSRASGGGRATSADGASAWGPARSPGCASRWRPRRGSRSRPGRSSSA